MQMMHYILDLLGIEPYGYIHYALTIVLILTIVHYLLEYALSTHTND